MIKQIVGLIVLGSVLACSPADKPQNSAPETPVTGHMGITGNVVKIENFKSDYVIPRHVEIWLPPSYATDTDKRYPVLYMHDGQNIFDPTQSQYSKTDWGVDEAMTELIADGKVREAIVVGNWSTERRNYEYMPQKAVTAETLPLYKKDFSELDAEKLQADNYLKFLTTELKTYIDETYRTRPAREDTYVMGSSMGGLISAYAVAEYPDIFGGCGCVSTHLPLGDGAIAEYLGAVLPDAGQHKLYFDYGTETLDHNYERYHDWLIPNLIEKGYTPGLDLHVEKFEGHEHSEKAWRARVHIPLIFLFGTE